jgi:hypothetical protein
MGRQPSSVTVSEHHNIACKLLGDAGKASESAWARKCNKAKEVSFSKTAQLCCLLNLSRKYILSFDFPL